MAQCHLFIIWTLCLYSCLAVDRGNFKTCDQSSFCKRQRATELGSSPWEVLLDTLNSTVNSLQVEVLNTKNQARLQLRLLALADSTLRIQLDELNPLRPRYQVEHVLVPELELSSLKILQKTADSIIFSFGTNTKATLLAKPLRLDVSQGDKLVVSLNARGLLNFEHQRTRQSIQASPVEEEPAREGEAVEAQIKQEIHVEEEEEKDSWEETYKSHVDSKPYGPTSVGMDISFPGSKHVYGIPEHADSFSLKETKNSDPYRLYNTDVFEYELWNPMALYGSIPFMISKSNDNTVGMLWLNAAETWVDVEDSSTGSVVSSIMNLVSGSLTNEQSKNTHWYSESGIIDIFLMMGPSPKDVARQYGKITGTTPLPQWFAIAYHQCRWNYNDQEDVHNVDGGFDEHDIPYDVMWLDIEHTDGKKYFTWDKIKFPNPLDMVANLTAKGRKLVTIVDPHVKRESSYFFHQDCEQMDFYVKDKDNKIYEGWCWPGSSSYPDFFNPAVRDYWASRFALDKYEGTTEDVYTWNDMNEPSVFNGPEITMPKDCRHYGGWEHRDVHNMYGMMVVEGTIRGQLMRSNYQRRPFVLSRAFFAGSQRFGAIWTGDNTADWGHLAISVPMLLSLSVSGMAFSGADVGGFFNNPDSELFIRWYQAAAFQPFFRSHSHLHTKRREPWVFDERTKELIKAAVKRRYTYLPYWYTLFYENEQQGVPPMRPIWMEYPNEPETFSIENQHFVGDALLVHPVTKSSAVDVNVYFPGQNTLWYDTDTYELYHGASYQTIPVTMEKTPVFQRGGSIIPKKERSRRAASLMHKDPYTLVIALDKEEKASGRLYIDDGQSFEYRQGKHLLIEFTLNKNTLMSKLIGNGRYETEVEIERIIIAGWKKNISQVQADGKSIEFNYSSAKKLLTLRKPGLSVAKEWIISFL